MRTDKSDSHAVSDARRQWIAVAGFLASLLVHVLSVIDVASPLGRVTWWLHGGIFVIWIPAMIMSQRLTRNVTRADQSGAILRGCPSWTPTALGALFALRSRELRSNSAADDRLSQEQSACGTV